MPDFEMMQVVHRGVHRPHSLRLHGMTGVSFLILMEGRSSIRIE